MNKVILSFLFIFTTLFSFSQITVNTNKKIGSIKNGGTEDVSLFVSEETITIKFLGVNSQNRWDTDVIKFNGGEKEIIYLYTTFLNVLSNSDKDYSLELTLGDDYNLTLTKTKVMGLSYITISNGTTTTRPLNKSQIDKLFGRN